MLSLLIFEKGCETAMQYHFDTPAPPRIGVESSKWDLMGPEPKPGVVPLSVADMEFLSPPQIITALEDTARSGMWGYTSWGDRYYEALRGWMSARHHWEIQRDWVAQVSGVVQGLGAAVRALTRPEDSILIQPPVYGPFSRAVRDNGRTLVESPLKLTGRRYEMDFDDLEEKLARPEVTAMILCSPHNPVGRVWTRQELKRLGDLCLANHVLVISDEIHNDLICPGQEHTVYAALGEDYARNCVIGTAASKTFSLAGLCCANLLIPDPEKKKALDQEIHRSGCYTHSIFGVRALEAGYTQCGDWVDQLMDYIQGNYRCLTEFLARRIPEAWASPLEGTYLAWVNLNCLEPDPKVRAGLLEQAGLYLSHGSGFGDGAFERFNLACARSTLEQALGRLAALLPA